MKRLLFLFGIALILVAGVMFASSNESVDYLILDDVITMEVEESAVYCKVKLPDGTSASCWFCDCDKLADLIKNLEKPVEP